MLNHLFREMSYRFRLLQLQLHLQRILLQSKKKDAPYHQYQRQSEIELIKL